MYLPAAASPTRAIRSAYYLSTHVLGVTLLLALLAETVRRSGLDLTVAQWFYDPQTQSFPWRTSRLLETLGHKLVLVLPVGVAISAMVAACASHWLPALRPLRGALWGIALTCGLGQLLIGQLKHHTALPRPYDLRMFGAYATIPAQFWARSRQEAGGALPSHHAGAGYAMLSLYFAGWALQRPALRWGGLAMGITAGLLFSAVRIIQGAHFLSQTLWSACIMWGLASVIFFGPITQSEPVLRDAGFRMGRP